MNILNGQNTFFSVFCQKHSLSTVILLPKETVSSFRRLPGAPAALSMAGPALEPGFPGGVRSLLRGQELTAPAAQLLLSEPLGARPAQPGNQNAGGICLAPACSALTSLLRAPVGRWDFLQE